VYEAKDTLHLDLEIFDPAYTLDSIVSGLNAGDLWVENATAGDATVRVPDPADPDGRAGAGGWVDSNFEDVETRNHRAEECFSAGGAGDETRDGTRDAALSAAPPTGISTTGFDELVRTYNPSHVRIIPILCLTVMDSGTGRMLLAANNVDLNFIADPPAIQICYREYSADAPKALAVGTLYPFRLIGGRYDRRDDHRQRDPGQ
jgi:hypothetical protein